MKNGLSFLVALLAAASAVAQDAKHGPLGEYIDSTANGANGLICSVLGDPIGLGIFACSAGQGSAGLSTVIQTFNIFMLAVSGIVFAWVIGAKSVSAAAEGEFLGKQSHNAWTPLRALLGAMFLIPVFKGYTLAQLIMYVILAAGSGVAGMSLKGLPNEFVTKSATIPAGLPKLDMYRGELSSGFQCLFKKSEWHEKLKRDYVTKKALDDANPLPTAPMDYTPPELMVRWGAMATRIPDGINVKFGGSGVPLSQITAANEYRDDICGEFTVQFPQIPAGVDETTTTIIQASRRAFSDMLETFVWKLGQVAVEIGAAPAGTDRNAVMLDKIQQLGVYTQNFDRKVLEDIVTAVSVENERLDSARQKASGGDWIALGFESINHMRSSVQMSTAMAPKKTVTEGAQNVDGGTGDGTESDGPGGLSKAAAAMGEAFGSAVEFLKGAGAALKDPWGALDRALDRRVNDLNAQVAATINASSADPIEALQNLGLAVLTGIWSAAKMIAVTWIGGAVVALMLPTSSAMEFWNTAFMSMMALFFIVAIPLAGFAMKGFITLPFVFAINWITAILNWLIVTVEGLFGAPIWGLLHLTAEGDGLGRETQKGYVFLANLALSPLLICGSYLLAKALMFAGWGLFKAFIAGGLLGLHSNNGDWWLNLIFITASVIILVEFAEKIVMVTAQTIHVIPRKVLAWVGGEFGNDVSMDMRDAGHFGNTKQVAQQIAGRFGPRPGYKAPGSGAADPKEDRQGSIHRPVDGGNRVEVSED